MSDSEPDYPYDEDTTDSDEDKTDQYEFDQEQFNCNIGADISYLRINNDHLMKRVDRLLEEVEFLKKRVELIEEWTNTRFQIGDSTSTTESGGLKTK